MTTRARGMTLLEVLVWVSMFTFAMGAIVSSVLYFYRANSVAITEADSVASAQRGIDSVVRSLREAAFASDGAYPIVSIGDDDIVFYADVDADAFIERVHYYVSGTSLMRGIVDPAGDPPSYGGDESVSVVSRYVRNTEESTPIFTYYDKEGTQITDYDRVSDVRFVSMNLIVDTDTARPPEALDIMSSAAMRNLAGQ